MKIDPPGEKRSKHDQKKKHATKIIKKRSKVRKRSARLMKGGSKIPKNNQKYSKKKSPTNTKKYPKYVLGCFVDFPPHSYPLWGALLLFCSVHSDLFLPPIALGHALPLPLLDAPRQQIIDRGGKWALHLYGLCAEGRDIVHIQIDKSQRSKNFSFFFFETRNYNKHIINLLMICLMILGMDF